MPDNIQNHTEFNTNPIINKDLYILSHILFPESDFSELSMI